MNSKELYYKSTEEEFPRKPTPEPATSKSPLGKKDQRPTCVSVQKLCRYTLDKSPRAKDSRKMGHGTKKAVQLSERVSWIKHHPFGELDRANRPTRPFGELDQTHRPTRPFSE